MKEKCEEVRKVVKMILGRFVSFYLGCFVRNSWFNVRIFE